MTIAVLQPCFIPDLYYLASLKNASKIVLQSDAQWSRKGRSHRFLIRTAEGLNWLTIPIKTEDKKKSINQVRIDFSDTTWIPKMLKTIEYAYRNSIYFDHYELEIRSDFENLTEFEYLNDAIKFMNERLWTYFEWKPESSKFIHSESSLQNPSELVHLFKPNHIHFEENGTQFQWQNELHTSSLKSYPVYRQHFTGFQYPCSILDLLFEVGPESFKILEAL